jgi:precorrin-2/cobalt-factor-2 C20-methyltransferase
MSSRLIAVGIGPGDPELITLKGARLLGEADVVVAPKASSGHTSVAGSIVADLVDPSRQRVVEQVYPMRKAQEGLAAFWRQAAGEIAELVRAGKTVAFVTLGDPMLYSTFLYLQAHLREIAPDVPIEVVSGLSSIHAAAALAGLPLAIADERLAILPATFEDDRLRRALEEFDTVILMKVYRVFERVRNLIGELGDRRAVYVKRAGLEGEAVFHDLGAVGEEDLDYLSLVIVRKSQPSRPPL